MKYSLLLSVILLGSWIPTTGVTSQNRKKPAAIARHKVTDEGQAAKSGTQVDPNIQVAGPLNPDNPAQSRPAPPQKGGEKPKGGTFSLLQIDNRTRFIINIYVDGVYRGAVDAWGNSEGFLDSGEHRVYGKAQLDSGTTVTWGPRVIFLSSGDQTRWTLTPNSGK
ncbi:MAG TPA: hypothetical protein PKZ53_26750 [Acidobacteriota bacterium]|nr:hypothetical protein [Acidobacteriota bacterium]